MEKPTFSRHIFWETDFDAIDWKKKEGYVIEKVVEYGNLEDWKLLKQLYGMDKIKEAVLNARYLRKKTSHFFSQIFDEPIENFRCYTSQPLNQELFPS